MSSIRGRLGLLFFAFFLLVMVSAGLTFWGLRAQAGSALVINLAGRQRMLVQQMTRLAYAIAAGEDARAELSAAAETFESTQAALESGGQVVYLPEGQVRVPAAQDTAIRAQLGRVGELWRAYQENLVTLQSSQPGTAEFDRALAEMERQSPGLVAEADAAVRMFQASSDQQVARLRWVQAGFLASALLLLALAGWFVHRSILDPLKRLGESAGRIGRGDLHTPVAVDGAGEIRLLADSFDGMRQELAVSRSRLVESAERLEERVEQRTRELEALYEVGREISSRRDLDASCAR
jgi:methyl-accepting chemotaxis protein